MRLLHRSRAVSRAVQPARCDEGAVMADLRAPFPWFGGKSTVAAQIWARFGDPVNYVEPFFGSGAVLLARPTPPKTGTVTDKGRLRANFWRGVRGGPDAGAGQADRPGVGVDLH